MKKSIVVILAVGLLASACSTYTCPTYAKEPVKEKKDVRVEEKI
ncbi:hypothetical protein [Fulvivirga imtechensis]|nr:hypothetical protein [Fulvivirga imtechensis]